MSRLKDMTISELVDIKRKYELELLKSINLAVKNFEEETGICPHSIGIEMTETTDIHHTKRSFTATRLSFLVSLEDI